MMLLETPRASKAKQRYRSVVHKLCSAAFMRLSRRRPPKSCSCLTVCAERPWSIVWAKLAATAVESAMAQGLAYARRLFFRGDCVNLHLLWMLITSETRGERFVHPFDKLRVSLPILLVDRQTKVSNAAFAILRWLYESCVCRSLN